MPPLKISRRWVLMNPGPVNVSPGVRKALLGPDVCHREPEFSKVSSSIRKRLLRIFRAAKTHDAALLTCSGTGAVEAMLGALARRGGKVLVISNGVYGDRMKDILEAQGTPVSVLAADLGSFPPLSAVESRLAEDPAITAMAMVHHETSTGMLNPLREVGRLAKRLGKIFLVDAVSSIGAEPIAMGGIDYLAGSAGKCLHGFPGVAFVLVSHAEAERLKSSKPRSVYFDLGAALRLQESGDTPFTPAVQLFYAFDAALAELERQGLGRRIQSYAAKSTLLQNGLGRLGLRFFISEKDRRSHVLTSVWLPAGITYRQLHDGLKKRGFVIYAGQSRLKDRIFRVANLGETSSGDLRRFLSKLGRLLPPPPRRPKAIVLAAGVGRRFGEATRRTPKCLLPLGGGQTLLGRYLDSFRQAGVRDVVIVRGHLKEKIAGECRRRGVGLKIRFIDNPDYTRGSILSLFRASRELDGPVLIMDADVYFPPAALDRLLASDKPSAFLVDTRSVSTGEEMMLLAKNGRLASITKKPDPALEVIGEATGIVKLSGEDAKSLKGILSDFVKRDRTEVEYEDSYAELMGRSKLGWEPVDGWFWTEIDFPKDLEKASRHLTGR